MKRLMLCACAFTLMANAALATGISDANSGLDALNKGDYANAVRLLTRAITVGKLNPPDKELAYVTRARAYIGQGKNDLALVDLDQAFAIDPADKDITTVRFMAKGIPPGPTLEESLGAIQQDVNAQGALSYVAAVHDGGKNMDWSEARVFEVGGAAGDAAACKMDFHFKLSRNDKVLMDKPFSFALQDVKSIQVVAKADLLNRINSDAGHADWRTQVTPALSVAAISVTGGVHEFDFKDAEAATRVSKAIARAALLCGGGKDVFNPDPVLASAALAPQQAPAMPVQPAPSAPAAGPPPAIAVAPLPATTQTIATQPAPPPAQPVLQPVSQRLPPPPEAPPAAAAMSKPAATPAAAAAAAPPVAAAAPAPAPSPESQVTADLNAQIKAANETADAQYKAQKDAADAKYKAAQEAYQQSQSQFQAQQAAYEAQRKTIEDQKSASDRAYQQQMEAWRAKVAACTAGDRTACAN